MKGILLFMILILIVLVGCETTGQAYTLPNLATHYSFDDNVYDLSGNENHGINFDATFIDGINGKAANFDGVDDYVRLESIGLNNAGLFGENPMSFSLWFKTSKQIDSWQYLISNKKDYNSNFLRVGFDVSGHLRLYTEEDNGRNRAFVTNNDYDDSEWHHVVFVRDGSVGKIYVDGGKEIKTGLTKSGDLGGLEDWFIGQDGNGNGDFKGSIDELRIYNYALSENKIKELYDAENKKLVTHYSFDDNVYDLSGNENHGINFGATFIDGINGKAANFDGVEDYVRLESIGLNNAGLFGENPMSFSLWFKTSGQIDSWQYLISNKKDYNSNFLRVGFDVSGHLRLYSEEGWGRNRAFATDNNYDDSEWHHVVFVRDGSVGKIYVDGGKEIKTGLTKSGDLGGLEDWFIGQDGNGNGDFKGSIDELRIYNYALSENKIKKLYGDISENSGLECLENVKSGLCGLSEHIFPLNNDLPDATNSISIYGPGDVFETGDFKIKLVAPEFLLTNQEYVLNITIENKKSESKLFKYNYNPCDSEIRTCYYAYGLVHVDDLPDSQLISQGKMSFYQNSFNSFEKKNFLIRFRPKMPILIKTSMEYFSLTYYFADNLDPMFINFNSWVKPDKDYGLKKGSGVRTLKECGGILQPTKIDIPVYVGPEKAYGYSNGKCCGDIFYPDIECCDNSDCLNNSNSDGYCVAGFCMPENKFSNKLMGDKSILIGYDFNSDDSCEEVPLSSMDSLVRQDFDKMELFYDHMSNVLINKPSNFVNFKIDKIIKVPLGLSGFLDGGKSQEDILNYLSSRCNINSDDFDLMILPTGISTRIGLAGLAIGGIGEGKVELYQKGSTGTLIHETGHMFGCIDLYEIMGGQLQWATSLYGDKRTVPYHLIDDNNINEISGNALQVCKGYLGWTDNNNNGIVDVEEWI